jgi:hypothetical protein
MMCRTALLAALLAVSLQISSASAQWQPDGIPVSATSGEQSQAIAVGGASGEVIVVWNDYRSDPQYGDLYAQIIKPDGSMLLAANGVPLCTAPYFQADASIASDGNGGAFVVWSDWRIGHPAPPSTADIYAQHIDAAGNMLWGTNGIPICAAVRMQDGGPVVSDGAGGALIAWNDERTSSLHPRVYMQRIDASGNALWIANGIKVATFSSDAWVKSIISDDAHGAIVSWWTSGGTDTYAQHMDASGALQWGTAGKPICIATATIGGAALVGDGSGGCIAAWQDYRTGAHGVYVQHLDASGVAQWASNGIMAMHQGPFSSIVSDGSGGAIIAISPFVDLYGYDHDIYLQRLDPSGNWLWGPLGVRASATEGDQYAARLVPDGAGGVIVTWDNEDVLEDDPSFGTTTDLYAQRVDADGTVLWAPSGVVVSAAPGAQKVSAVAAGTGQAIAVFSDTRSDTSPDVFAMEIGTSATAVNRGAAPSFVVGEARPNPFSDATTLDVVLSSPGTVQLDVFDVAGRRVSGARYSSLSAGAHSLRVSSIAGGGRQITSGVYFCRVTAGRQSITRKLVIAR